MRLKRNNYVIWHKNIGHHAYFRELTTILRLSDGDKLTGNDFIIFKHGCGGDSNYTMEKGPDGQDDQNKLSEESKTKMKKHCENHIFYHVEVELIGNSSNTYEYEDSGKQTNIQY